ncbi:nitroreductase family protein [Christensenellaceae bacterium OttesenSCG-928-L17]|nr:nitroreductase family protein [Christensenellaceae bacterium OttesenSCG-928-L17]
MDTMKALAMRKSTRDFSNRQVPENDMETILKAACAAPVGHGEYHALRLTVIRDEDVLDDIRRTAVDCFRDPILDIYYGAPTVVAISTSHGSILELDMANAGAIAQSMMLAATDLGIDSCYIWGTVLALRAEPDLGDDIDLPDGHEVIASVAFGYANDPDDSEKPMDLEKISIHWVR